MLYLLIYHVYIDSLIIYEDKNYINIYNFTLNSFYFLNINKLELSNIKNCSANIKIDAFD